MKKILILLSITIISSFSFTRVNALENVYYRNSNDVEFTKEEYNYFYDIYGLKYIENLKQEDYDWYSDLNINSNDIEAKTYYDYENLTKASTHTTASKKLIITKSCSTTKCTILTATKWLKEPKTRSYDVIGARFEGVSLKENTILTQLKSSAGTAKFNNLKSSKIGLGVSVKLPENATNIIIEQKFYTTKGGKIYASYQHATKDISLATSKLYSINSSGYGGVFSFYDAAANVFDQMGGVDISV